MTTAMTPTPDRSVALKPLGSDVVNIAAINAMAQVLLDRAEWASKSLIDVQSAKTTATDNDFSNTSFADAPSLAGLTFTDVSAGDIIVLHATATLFVAESGTGAGDGTSCDLRWLVDGATDLTVAAGAYPQVLWGSALVVSGNDSRVASFADTHTPAAPAASVTAKLQMKGAGDGGFVIYNPYTSIIGVHFRLGAA